MPSSPAATAHAPRLPAGTPPHLAIEHFARVAPNQAALIHSTGAGALSSTLQWLAAFAVGIVACALAASHCGAEVTRRQAVLPLLVSLAVAAVALTRAKSSTADAVASTEWTRVSYAELHARVTGTTRALRGAGACDGARVLVLHVPPTRADLVVLLVALQAAGAVVVWADPAALPSKRAWLRAILNLEPRLIVCSRTVWQVLRFAAWVVCAPSPGVSSRRVDPTAAWPGRHGQWRCSTSQEQERAKHRGAGPAHAASGRDGVVAIMLTSGSTGVAKSVQITAEMLRRQAIAYEALLGAEGAATLPRPTLHCFVNLCVHDVSRGCTAILHPMGLSHPRHSISAAALHHIVNRFDVGLVSAPPAVWNALACTLPAGSLRSLQHGLVGGAEVTTPTLQKVAQLTRGPRLSVVYGATEGLPLAWCAPSDAVAPATLRRTALGGGACLGRAAKGVALWVDTSVWRRSGHREPALASVGATREAAAAAAASATLGELVASGPAVSPSAGGDFYTGDVVALDADGRVWLYGRLAQLVRCGAGRGSVPPVAVEMVMLATAKLSACALIEASALTPVLVYKPAAGLARTHILEHLGGALRRSVWAHLSPVLQYLHYDGVWPVDARHSSKIDRAQIRAWAALQLGQVEAWRAGDTIQD